MTRHLKSRVGGFAAVIGVVLTVAACGSSSSKSNSSSAPAPAASSTSTPSSTQASSLMITTTKGAAGTYLVGTSGRALYLWVADSGGKSACSGACAGVWPPVTTTGKPAVAGGVSAADVGTISRSDGAKQVTYKGHPLYYFAGDPTSGTVKGQGSNSFGAKWWLVTPAGAAITSGGSSSSTVSSSSSGSSSGSSSSSGGASSSGGGWG